MYNESQQTTPKNGYIIVFQDGEYEVEFADSVEDVVAIVYNRKAEIYELGAEVEVRRSLVPVLEKSVVYR